MEAVYTLLRSDCQSLTLIPTPESTDSMWCAVSWPDSLGPHELEPTTRLLQGIFQARIWSGLPLPTPVILLIQELNPGLSSLLHWQADSWPLAPPVYRSDLNLIRCIVSTHLKERGRKSATIKRLSGSFSHQTSCDKYHLWWKADPNVPLQSLKTNGKKKNTFLCAYSWLVWLTWCSWLSLSPKKELKPCQIPKVLLQQILQDPPCYVARENVRICPSEVRQKN